MDAFIFLQSILIFLSLLLTSGSSVGEKPPLEAIQETRKPVSSDPFMATTIHADTTPTTIPIVQPTTPGTTTPIVDSPPPPYSFNPTPTPVTTPITTPVTTPITTPVTTPITTPVTTPITTPTTAPATTTGGSWCIASSSASETALQVALDYACGYGGADCASIQPSGTCYNPNTLRDHASYAFNDYYHKNPAPTSCVFGGAAQLTTTDPSTGSCRFPSSTASTSTNTSTTPPVTTTPTPTTPMLTPPSPTLTPMTPGSTIYDGSEPAGLPSSATSVSCTQLLVFTATGLVGWVFGPNHH